MEAFYVCFFLQISSTQWASFTLQTSTQAIGSKAMHAKKQTDIVFITFVVGN